MAGVQDWRAKFFVLFSSVAALLGDAGNSAHAAASGFMDGLVWARQRADLLGTALRWGPIAEVGRWVRLASRRRGDDKAMPVSPREVLEVLNRVFSGRCLSSMFAYWRGLPCCMSILAEGKLTGERDCHL